MDTNGDGIVDENESQNQPVLTGNNLTTEEIEMDTNGDGIVDENESQNQPTSGWGRHQTVPHYQFVLVCEIIFWYHLFRDPRLEECGAPSHGCPLHTNFLWAL